MFAYFQQNIWLIVLAGPTHRCILFVLVPSNGGLPPFLRSTVLGVGAVCVVTGVGRPIRRLGPRALGQHLGPHCLCHVAAKEAHPP